MIYTDFESVLVPEDNEKQNPDESYTNKYQKYVVCSNGYKLELTDDKFRKSFKLYLGEDLVNNFINHCNWIRTHNHLVHKRTLNHLAKLA